MALVGTRRGRMPMQAQAQAAPEEGDEESPPPTIDERRHLVSIAALCMCTLTHAYLLISVFPYSGFMAIHLVNGLNEENAGGFAGLISSAFMLGRAFSSYPWGKAADRYGRKTVVRVSLVLSAISTLLFGASPTLPCALAARFCLGLSNGMPGTAKTMAYELARGVTSLETKGMGLIFSMWGIGYLICPAVGGWLAEPLVQYPDAAWAHTRSMEPFLNRFPFLLPNLVGAGCCAVSWVGVTYLIEETLPKEHKKELKYIFSDLGEGMRGFYQRHFKSSIVNDGEAIPLLSSKPVTSSGSTLSHTKGKTDLPLASTPLQGDSTASIASLWRRKRTRQHLVAFWLYSFFIISLDEALPLFCMSKGGGIGINEALIGKILSASGLIFASLQYIIYAAVVDRWGVYPALKVGSLVSALLVLTMPLSVPLNATASSGKVSNSAFVFLSLTMAIILIFSMIFQSSITIATNGTVPATHRATMNGLSMLGGSFTKGVGPAFAGLWVSFSLSSGIVDPMWGSVLIFGVIGGLGLTVSCYTACILDKADTDTFRSVDDGDSTSGDGNQVKETILG